MMWGCFCHWSYQTFVEGRATNFRTCTTTPLADRLTLCGADAAKVAVPTSAIVDCIDVGGDVRQRDITARKYPRLAGC
jgi:hypothetical protein